MPENKSNLEKIKLDLKLRLAKAKEQGVSPLSPLAPDLIEKFRKLLPPSDKDKNKT